MLANYLMGLREGLEAALIVTILVTYLVKNDQRSKLRHIWLGVAVAVALSFGLGAFFTTSSYYLPFKEQEILGGALSVLTVALITWMIFWLASHAKSLKGELHSSVDKALATSAVALVLVSFLAVAREGLETALFVWTAILATDETTEPLMGVLLGLSTSVVIGFLLYKGAVRINLQKFFFYTGFGLITVAAGVLSYGIHDFQEAGVLPGLDIRAFDVSGLIAPDGWLGTILRGTINFTPNPSLLQTVIWFLYILPVLALFYKKTRIRPSIITKAN